jgi:MFS family permease
MGLQSQPLTANEETPLLSETSPSDSKPSRPYRNIILLLCSVLILVQCGEELSQPPQSRISEAIICYRHYETADPSKLLADRSSVSPGAIGGVAEELCKIEAVQNQLSSLRGFQGFLDGGPSLLLALPFGWAADKYGRKPILTLGVLSFVLQAAWVEIVCWFWQSFDIRWTWASSLHGLMGGSSPVVSALFFVIVSDVVPEEDRSKVFLQLGGANLVSTVCMPLLAAWLMEITPWIPVIAGTLGKACAVLLVLAMPETLGYQHQTDNTSPTSPEEEDPTTEQQISSSANKPPYLSTLRSSTAFLLHDWRVPALTLTFLLHLIVANNSALTTQYISTRYSLHLSQATQLLTLRALANITLLFALLPLLSAALTTTLHLSPARRDLYMSRASMSAWALGFTAFGLAPTLASATLGMGLSALGSGSFFLIRSFLTPLVPGRNVAALYSVVSVVDTLGAMLGAPLLAVLFNRGLRVGAPGLPFLFLGAVCAGVAVLLCVVGVRKGEEEDVGKRGEVDGVGDSRSVAEDA